MANATPCQTPGAVYKTQITPYGAILDVHFHRLIDLTEDEAALLETNLHNAVELVLAPLWARAEPLDIRAKRWAIYETWPAPERDSSDESELHKWINYGDYSNVFEPWHSLIVAWEMGLPEAHADALCSKPAGTGTCTRIPGHKGGCAITSSHLPEHSEATRRAAERAEQKWLGRLDG